MEAQLWILLRLLVAALLGGVIGYEREATGKAAGLRTHMLVAMGAALFVSFGAIFALEFPALAPPPPPGNYRLQIEPLSTVTAIVTGISVLGAGTVFVSGQQQRVKGLTTAASIWVTAAVGIAVGPDRYIVAAGAVVLAFLILRVVQHIPVDGRRRSAGTTGSGADHL